MRTYLCSTCKQKVPRKQLIEHRKSCSGDLHEDKGAAGAAAKGMKAVIWSLLAAGLALGSVYLGRSSFESLAQMRQLERVPATTVRAVLPGEANLNGTVSLAEPSLTSPETSTRCAYYRLLVERKERDSDGDTRWVTVRDESEFVPFTLRDDTGEIRIRPGRQVKFSVPESWSTRRGDMRYTEYRIDPGDSLFVFGYVVRGDSGFEVVFHRDGHYQPIISELGETRERIGMAGGSIAKVWLGLVALAAGLSILISLFRQHRLLLYFTVLNLAVAIYLVFLGLQMMKLDLEAAAERLETYRTTVQNEIQTELQAFGLQWNGDWTALAENDLLQTEVLPSDTRKRLTEIRLNLAQSVDRVRTQKQAFPEFLLAPLWGIPGQPSLPLPPVDQKQLEAEEQEHQRAKLPPLIGWAVIGVSLLTGAVTFGIGFRKVKFKRCMENIPTSPTQGVSFGIAEVKGVVDLGESADLLTSPLTHQPCVQYHYKVEEKRGSGKKSRWVTLVNENRRIPFLCRDGDGTLLIDPAGADVVSSHRTTRRKFRTRYTETRLEHGDPLYAIGQCAINPARGDRLLMKNPEEKDTPFILSNLSEPRVMLRMARIGILLLNVSFAGILLMALVLFGLSGSFAATDYLAAALTAPVFMTCITLALHYNDLVFLRERVRRNASNIDVALQKRADLVPQLENVTKGLIQHEREVQEAVTLMRSHLSTEDSPEAVSASTEAAPLQKMLMVRENYPELKSDEQFSRFMRTLIVLENELSLMRMGYNDAVETYNTRLQTFPDVFFANLFQFKPASLLFAETSVVRIPPSIQTLWERDQTPSAPTEEESEEDEAPDAEAVSTPAALAAADLPSDDEPAGEGEGNDIQSEFISLMEQPGEEALPHFAKLESLYPSIRELSPAAYRHWKAEILKAMEADEVITVFEFALQKSITRYLDPHFGLDPKRPVRHRKIETMLDSVNDLLSLLACMEETPETRESVFQAGIQNLNHSDTSAFSLRELDTGNLGEFDRILEDIAHATPMCRANVMYACRALVEMNDDATPDQVLMSYAIADTLKQERPDWNA
jgi:hypothetical protein